MTAHAPRVSVLLPVHNGGSALRLAVCSILQQTLTDWELLILDDGSTDSSTAPLAHCADTRVRVIADGHRRGLAWRLNQGIDVARGEYLARMDHDDVAFPGRLDAQAQYLDAHSDIDLLGARALAITAEGAPLGLLPFGKSHEEICAAPWRGFPLPHPTWMGRSSWFRAFRYRMPEVRRAEDLDLLLRAYSRSRFACLPEPLLGYRVTSVPLLKVLTARYGVGMAQLREHLARGRVGYAALGFAASAVKALADVGVKLTGDELSSVRGIQPLVTAGLVEAWQQVWSRTTDCAIKTFRAAAA